MREKQYIAIDLKSFYASVECVERKLDPLTTNLVVADISKTEKTIGLAVSPSLKTFGIPGRPRLFEVVQKVKEVNYKRKLNAPGHRLKGESYNIVELNADPSLAVSYIVAPPQMAKYMEVSTRIYEVYLKYISPEDIHVYSVDEVFIDATEYLTTYKCDAHNLALRMIRDVLKTTGITATAGIGTNLYLAKVAMDIMAKKMPADKDGVRIAELDEMKYRELLWDHTPLTSFWRVGNGYATKLQAYGMYTMGDVARRSITDEESLYKLFGVNAELLIDHAWGWEPCLISDIKAYKPQTNSVSSGQVLSSPYKRDQARLIVHEMIDLLVLDLVEKHLVTDQIVLDIGYDIENLTDSKAAKEYRGEVVIDHYGRRIPKGAHGSERLGGYTSSTKLITEGALRLFDRIINPKLNDFFKVILVTGARQVGKTTMMKHLAEGSDRTYVSMDNMMARILAKSDPVLFFQTYKPPILIDEVQKAPELFEQIKVICDESDEKGLIWLTGSQQYKMMEKVRETLAGRIGILELYSLSAREKAGLVFDEDLDFSLDTLRSRQQRLPKNDVIKVFNHIWEGGMPQVQGVDEELRGEYFNSYIDTYLMRDVADAGGITDAVRFRKFLVGCASLVSEQVNYATLAETAEIAPSTAKEWLKVLVGLHIVYLLAPYSNNELKRLSKTPKLYFCDTGLCAFLSMWLTADTLRNGAASGHYYENYVVMELVKNYAYARSKVNLTYFRDSNAKEIDVFVEENNVIHPLEIKKSASPDRREVKKYSVIDKSSLNRGNGGIICMCEEPIPIDADNCFIPSNLI